MLRRMSILPSAAHFRDDGGPDSGVSAGARPPGSILRGKYRLGASIGRGGMGEVFEAKELATGRLVAVKVVSRAFADDLLMARLHREAEAARRVRSEFVPELYDVDSTADGELFLVMERLYGETLAERLRARSGVLTWAEVRALGEDVLHGLIDAHAAGVVHRDLKPGNIFLERRASASPLAAATERAKVLDFGVCKLDVHDGESLTSTGEAVGTISYMAPEQIRGASKVDERADIYSFAMMVFEALSGRLAHDASGQIAMIASKLERPARNLREVVRTPVPAGLDALLARCLSRKPIDRVATAHDLLRAWCALGPPTMQPVAGPIADRPDVQFAPETGVTAATAAMPTPRGTRIGLIVAAGALAASSVVLVFALRGREPSAPPAPSAQVPAAQVPAAQVGAPSAAPADTIPSIPVSALAPAPPEPVSMDDDAADAGQPRVAKPGAVRKRPPPKGGAAPRATTTTPQIAVEPRY